MRRILPVVALIFAASTPSVRAIPSQAHVVVVRGQQQYAPAPERWTLVLHATDAPSVRKGGLPGEPDVH